MVGIWGAGSSGKTTLASSLSMKIFHHFQDHCFIDNIREESNQHGLKVLQQKIISRVFTIEMQLQDVEEGKRMISRLRRSNIFVILDDVDDCKQLDALAGSHN
ncbi:hypothetical protein L1987_53529 [Smallanthus sonchifolius]|uniref:Uncharacterized protein n=1 Tax=Smallanthus sonchifolius TaxID=185202 RepID=A0ACB9EVW3_9ASTR|nr:hypothetical protein L1987_53529 [Smallanthus sonchifolius]